MSVEKISVTVAAADLKWLRAYARRRHNGNLHHRMATAFVAAARAGLRITVPSPVVVEWWRGRTDAREELLLAVEHFPTVRVLSA